MMGCGCGGASDWINASFMAGLLRGCFSRSTSFTVLSEVFGRLTGSSRFRTSPLVWSVIRRRQPWCCLQTSGWQMSGNAVGRP